ncbi:MAG: hypothetical protein ACFFFK_12790 [Candidatus Thorarchaeota archaeon]
MKILYLHNSSGAFVAVIEWLIENDHEVIVLIEGCEDKTHHTTRFSQTIAIDNRAEFLQKIVSRIESFDADLIHVTDDLESLKLARQSAPLTPIVFSIHSASIVDTFENQEQLKQADRVLASTPDILPKLAPILNAEWYDRPTPKWFRYTGGRKEGTALMIYSQTFPKDYRDLAKSWCKERKIELTILNRDETHYNHRDMPDIYSRFEYVLDFKGYEDHPESLSKVAKEAALCGCKIVHDSNLQKVILPGELPRVTADKFINLYKELIARSKG